MHIVLVEPSRVGTMVMSRLLAEHGHRVACFQEGRDAFDYVCRAQDAEVLLTSFELGDYSGMELCWDTRAMADAEQRALYVIAMSSSYDHDRLTKALDGGADDFISKPPNPRELTARLRAAERLNQARRELIALANVDPLTGLMNRRAFFRRGEPALAGACRTGPVSAVMFDIDHFKRVNDGFGHAAGDDAIRQVAALAASWAASSGAGRIAGRLGGEEFALLLPGMAAADARAVAEDLRFAVSRAKITTGGAVFGVTVSLGVATATEPLSLDRLLCLADTALYRAKTQGRNRVELAGAADGAEGQPPSAGSGLSLRSRDARDAVSLAS